MLREHAKTEFCKQEAVTASPDLFFTSKKITQSLKACIIESF